MVMQGKWLRFERVDAVIILERLPCGLHEGVAGPRITQSCHRFGIRVGDGSRRHLSPLRGWVGSTLSRGLRPGLYSLAAAAELLGLGESLGGWECQ